MILVLSNFLFEMGCDCVRERGTKFASELKVDNFSATHQIKVESEYGETTADTAIEQS